MQMSNLKWDSKGLNDLKVRIQKWCGGLLVKAALLSQKCEIHSFLPSTPELTSRPKLPPIFRPRSNLTPSGAGVERIGVSHRGFGPLQNSTPQISYPYGHVHGVPQTPPCPPLDTHTHTHPPTHPHTHTHTHPQTRTQVLDCRHQERAVPGASPRVARGSRQVCVCVCVWVGGWVGGWVYARAFACVRYSCTNFCRVRSLHSARSSHLHTRARTRTHTHTATRSPPSRTSPASLPRLSRRCVSPPVCFRL